MTAFLGFGRQVEGVVFVGGEGVGDPLRDLDAELGQGFDLVRVVGHQTDFGKPELAQHFSGRQKDPLIGLKPQPFITSGT